MSTALILPDPATLPTRFKLTEAARRKAEAAEAARLRAEAMRPDREKLLAVADAIAEIKIPAVDTMLAATAMQVREILDNAIRAIRGVIREANQE